jgi:hypothetical protein
VERLQSWIARRIAAFVVSRVGRWVLRFVVFVFGLAGLILAGVLTASTEIALQAANVDGLANEAYFAALAGLMTVLAIGLLVQLATALGAGMRWLLESRATIEGWLVNRGAAREQAPKLVDELVFDRGASDVLLPFALGLAVQFIVTEGVVLYSLAAGIHARPVALALGFEVAVIFLYMMFFSIGLGAVRRGVSR